MLPLQLGHIGDQHRRSFESIAPSSCETPCVKGPIRPAPPPPHPYRLLDRSRGQAPCASLGTCCCSSRNNAPFYSRRFGMWVTRSANQSTAWKLFDVSPFLDCFGADSSPGHGCVLVRPAFAKGKTPSPSNPSVGCANDPALPSPHREGPAHAKIVTAACSSTRRVPHSHTGHYTAETCGHKHQAASLLPPGSTTPFAIAHRLVQNASSEPPVTALSVSSATSPASDKPDRSRATSPDNILAPYRPLDKRGMFEQNNFDFRVLPLRFSSSSIGGPEAPQPLQPSTMCERSPPLRREGPGRHGAAGLGACSLCFGRQRP